MIYDDLPINSMVDLSMATLVITKGYIILHMKSSVNFIIARWGPSVLQVGISEWQLVKLLDGGWGDSTTGYLLHSHGKWPI